MTHLCLLQAQESRSIQSNLKGVGLGDAAISEIQCAEFCAVSSKFGNTLNSK